MDINETIIKLRSARSRHGFSLRAERAAAVDAIRAALKLALPMIVAEASELPMTWSDGEWTRPGKALVIVTCDYDSEQFAHSETRWETWLFVRPHGKLGHGRKFETRSCEGTEIGWAAETPRDIGLREAVRHYGGENVLRGLLDALAKAAEKHDRKAADLDASTARLRAALVALERVEQGASTPIFSSPEEELAAPPEPTLAPLPTPK